MMLDHTNCPYCDGDNIQYDDEEKKWFCNDCYEYFAVKHIWDINDMSDEIN